MAPISDPRAGTEPQCPAGHHYPTRSMEFLDFFGFGQWKDTLQTHFEVLPGCGGVTQVSDGRQMVNDYIRWTWDFLTPWANGRLVSQHLAVQYGSARMRAMMIPGMYFFCEPYAEQYMETTGNTYGGARLGCP